MTIALITGGSRGLGKSMALHLAKAGHDIILTYNSKAQEAEMVVAQIQSLGRKAIAIQLNVGEASTFPIFATLLQKNLTETWQTNQFDILINNAGIGINSPLAETTEETFDTLMNIHLKGPFFLTQTLVPLLNDGARIINISSGLTRFSMPGYSAYAAMKGAIEVLTHYQAKELGARGISAICVAPGAIETDFGDGLVRDNKTVNDHIAAQTALGRVGLPDDIGGAIAALASKDARWINGQRIEVSGGMLV